MLFATAGSKVYIGGVLAMKSADFILSDFNAQVWTEITGLDTIGTFGDTSAAITQPIIGEARDKTIKGTRNAGTLELVANINYADAGQLAAIAAEKTIHDYAFKIVMNDAPSGGTPSERYFIGKVMSAAEALNQANNAMMLNLSIAINSNVVRVAAAGAGSAPDNTVLPAITGTAQEGETLTSSTGTWTGTPTPSYAYQWFSDGESIPGATESTYDVQAGDVGNVITVQVTATNVNGVASAISAATSTVIAAE